MRYLKRGCEKTNRNSESQVRGWYRGRAMTKSHVFLANFLGPVSIHDLFHIPGRSRLASERVRYFVVYVGFSLIFGVLYSAELSHIAFVVFALAALYSYVYFEILFVRDNGNIRYPKQLFPSA